jgi:hypothetical protein
MGSTRTFKHGIGIGIGTTDVRAETRPLCRERVWSLVVRGSSWMVWGPGFGLKGKRLLRVTSLALRRFVPDEMRLPNP